jgi:hypothetical protein
MVLLATIVILTVFEAVHEGLVERGKKTIAGLIEFVKLAVIATLPVFYMGYMDYDYYYSDWRHLFWFLVPYYIGWMCIRYAIFDFIHNAAAGWNLYHIGTTKLYDRILSWWVDEKIATPRPRWFWITRTLLLAVGVSLILHL